MPNLSWKPETAFVYLDGTFRVVRQPFVQLFSVHAYIRASKCTKQVPLVFVLMSCRRKKDYREVFRAILRMLPRRPSVKAVVMDFESAMWNALRHVLPNTTLRGCAFHWKQALWRKVQELGLQVPYAKYNDVTKFVRKLMALHATGAYTIIVGQKPVVYLSRNDLFQNRSCVGYRGPTPGHCSPASLLFWKDYSDNLLSASALLREIGGLVGV